VTETTVNIHGLILHVIALPCTYIYIFHEFKCQYDLIHMFMSLEMQQDDIHLTC